MNAEIVVANEHLRDPLSTGSRKTVLPPVVRLPAIDAQRHDHVLLPGSARKSSSYVSIPTVWPARKNLPPHRNLREPSPRDGRLSRMLSSEKSGRKAFNLANFWQRKPTTPRLIREKTSQSDQNSDELPKMGAFGFHSNYSEISGQSWQDVCLVC